MTLEFDVDIGYITDDGSKDMPQWVKLNDEDGQHPSTVYVNNDSYQRSISENAKLRELAEKAWKAAEMLCQAWNGPCHADGVSIKPSCPLDERDELCVYGLIQRDLRELGIEVDG